MHAPAGLHASADAAGALEDLCPALPSLSSAEHIPSFLGVEFRAKIARAEGLRGITTRHAQNRGAEGHSRVEVDKNPMGRRHDELQARISH